MKRRIANWHLSAAAVAVLVTVLACQAASFVDYVNPLIGTDAHGHVYPGATYPSAWYNFRRTHVNKQTIFKECVCPVYFRVLLQSLILL